MTTGVPDEDEFAAAMTQMREQLAPAERDKLDATLRDALMLRLQQANAMNDAMTALRLLHRPGAGERAGFCDECGHVTPCQTLRFIEPFRLLS